MGRLIDLTGKRFGRLTVIGRADNKGKISVWKCRCDCGTEKDIMSSHLRYGRIVSCGCQSRERIAKLNLTHGKSKTRLYNIWTGIKTRCYDKNCSSYKNYGERGIIMCDEWIDNYEAFESWAESKGYRDDLSIERIDVNGNYCPENCRWATHKEQSNNTRRNIKVDYQGETLTLKELSEKLKIDYKRLFKAYRDYGMNLQESIEYAAYLRKKLKKG